jgi:hypothetical protein
MCSIIASDRGYIVVLDTVLEPFERFILTPGRQALITTRP